MKKLMFAAVCAAGLVSFGKDADSTKYYVLNKDTHQYVGFKEVNGLGYQNENGTNVITQVNKTSDNLKASSYTFDELQKLFSVISEMEGFGTTLDRKFELMWVDTSNGMFVMKSRKFSDAFKKED